MGDLLYAITEWLRSTPLSGFALDMSESPLTLWIVTHFWALPTLQVLHILAIAGSFAAVLMLSMRVVGLGGHATLAEATRNYTRVLWWSLGFVVLSGGLMLFGDTVRNLLNSIFWIKMILVVVGILTAILFAKSLRRQLSTGHQEVGAGTKTTAIFLVLLWCLIMVCGRWIAYAPV